MPLTASGAALTAREAEIVACLADGLTNIDTGERLGLSHLTVKSHLVRIALKLGTGDRAGIVGAAYLEGALRRRALPAGFVVPALSAAKFEVLVLVARGGSNSEIAAQLGVAVDTVKSRVHGLLVLLHATNRAQAVALAVDCGVLPLVPRVRAGAAR